jgi:hypothetical protein
MSKGRSVFVISSLLVTLLASSCAEDTVCSVDAADYDQSCVVAADCVIVTDGNLCSDCRCPRAVINKSSLAQFQDDTSSIDSPLNECDCAAFLDVECVDGQCQGIDVLE